MGQALYRKHRPKSLDEVVGQEHITQTLSQALKTGRISHAYLLTGPRGTGKTTVARILAHEISGLQYSDESMHPDIIEIDAASNRRIDEIRELRDKVYIAPTSARYKVYIIDEVHMLTKEAFNALLKTLEEPPAHVVFILATTDAHKLPDTIISRTQRFSFQPINRAKVIMHLQSIAQQEKIAVSTEALELLAEHGDGSFRDSISLLDQAASQGKKLELVDVQQLLGLPPITEVESLLQDTIVGSDSAAIMSRLSSLYNSGYHAAAIAKQLGGLLRKQLVQKQSWAASALGLQLLQHLIEVPSSPDPERFLEIVLLRAKITAPLNQAKVEAPETVDTPEPQPLKEKKPEVEKQSSKHKAPTEPQAFSETTWPEVLGVLKQRHNTLYGLVRMAQPSFSEKDKLILTFSFAFHEKRIKEANNRRLLADIIHELTGQIVSVDCVLDKNLPAPKTVPIHKESPPKPDLAAISNIFGGAELLES